MNTDEFLTHVSNWLESETAINFRRQDQRDSEGRGPNGTEQMFGTLRELATVRTRDSEIIREVVDGGFEQEFMGDVITYPVKETVVERKQSTVSINIYGSLQPETGRWVYPSDLISKLSASLKAAGANFMYFGQHNIGFVSMSGDRLGAVMVNNQDEERGQFDLVMNWLECFEYGLNTIEEVTINQHIDVGLGCEPNGDVTIVKP